MRFNSTDAIIFEKKLFELGYKKYHQNYKNSTYCFWKNFKYKINNEENKLEGYQIGLAFYDYSQYLNNPSPTPIHVSFHFLLNNNEDIDSLDLTISDNKTTVENFEKFCKSFFKYWRKNKQKICS